MPTATTRIPPAPSALSTTLSSHPSALHSHKHTHPLAIQIQHNLQYQHDWTDLRIHTHSPLTDHLLPRPLISGRPPKRIYVHPDDQVDELKRGVSEEDVVVWREWVLPTHLKEKWSLRRFGEVFDGIGKDEPRAVGSDEDEGEEEQDGSERGRQGRRRRKTRGKQRVLLATVGDDSTVVYYIVHDGLVKPRQN